MSAPILLPKTLNLKLESLNTQTMREQKSTAFVPKPQHLNPYTGKISKALNS